MGKKHPQHPTHPPHAPTPHSSTTATSTAPLLKLSLELHHATFKNDLTELARLIDSKQYDVNAVDIYGNTAMHIGVMLRHRACIELLLNAGAKITVKNKQGFTSIHEATSVGDRDILRLLWSTYKSRAKASQELSGFLTHLTAIPDFKVTFVWRVESWIPFIGRLLPTDSITLSKKGSDIRVDTHMLELAGLKWLHHPYSFLLKPRIEVKDVDKIPAGETVPTTNTSSASSTAATPTPSKSTLSPELQAHSESREPFLVFTLDHEMKKWQCVSTDEEKEQKEAERQARKDEAAKSKGKAEKKLKHKKSSAHAADPSSVVESTTLAASEAASSTAATPAPSTTAASSTSTPSTPVDIDLEYELDDYQSAPITSSFSPGRLIFKPVSPSWTSLSSWTSFIGLTAPTQKVEQVGSWTAKIWKVEDIRIHMLRRYEHLTKEEIDEIQQRSSKMKNILSKPLALKQHLEEKQKEGEEGAEEDEEDEDSDSDELESEEEPSKTSAASSSTTATAPSSESIADTAAKSQSSASKRPHHHKKKKKQTHQHRTSLPPPPPSTITFEKYFHAKNRQAFTAVDMEEVFEKERDEALTKDSASATTLEEETIELKDAPDQKLDLDADSTDPSAIDLAVADSAPVSAPAPITLQPVAGYSLVPDSDTTPYLHLGRTMLSQETRKKYTARLAMADSFPLQMQTVIHVVDLLFGTSIPQLVAKFKHFVTQELPPGFPVRITAPIFPAISIDVSIVDFEEGKGIEYTRNNPAACTTNEDAFFALPADYTREEETDEEKHKRQQKYRKRWKAGQTTQQQQEKKDQHGAAAVSSTANSTPTEVALSTPSS